ncbi:hypothetical protein AB1046_07940 [Promicromonospora sp. Populi]|uniref:hypothetical protein n=1 Tax=Promicromonospora sp. Populi TaxID=3239420 RepID=UPI0034E23F1A
MVSISSVSTSSVSTSSVSIGTVSTNARPAPRGATRDTTRDSARDSARDTPHEHSWTTESRHPTSAGHVLYVRCTACGTHRVDLQDHKDAPPMPLSRVVGNASETAAPVSAS